MKNLDAVPVSVAELEATMREFEDDPSTFVRHFAAMRYLLFHTEPNTIPIQLWFCVLCGAVYALQQNPDPTVVSWCSACNADTVHSPVISVHPFMTRTL